MTARSKRPHVLFRVLAGPRVGFGHLVRAVSLAQSLGVAPRVSLRGGAAAHRVASRFGCRVVKEGTAATVLTRERPDILVLDDRDARFTAGWRRAARGLGILVVSIHDLGLGLGEADLIVDGSVVTLGAHPEGAGCLLGPRFAILSAATLALRRRGAREKREGVVVTLGGGANARRAWDLAEAIEGAGAGGPILVAGGFHASRSERPGDRYRLVTPLASERLAAALARAKVAVVGGGVTLYEACMLGTPVVTVSVAESQRPTVRAMADAGACVDGGRLASPRDVPRIARLVRLLETDAEGRRRVSTAGKRLVDGRGAARVAREILSRWSRAGRQVAS